jgi:FkbM family methyltransferase
MILILFVVIATQSKCNRGVFIDLGANRGDNLERFYQKRHDILKYFPKRAPEVEWCYHAFEGNAMWKQQLINTSAKIINMGIDSGNIELHVPMAVVARDIQTVYMRISNAKDSAGSTIVPEKRIVGNWTMVEVPAINIGSLWSRFDVRNESAPIILKIDVEGAEYDLLDTLLSSGIACKKISGIIVEFHNKKIGKNKKIRKDYFVSRFRNCGVVVCVDTGRNRWGIDEYKCL